MLKLFSLCAVFLGNGRFGVLLFYLIKGKMSKGKINEIVLAFLFFKAFLEILSIINIQRFCHRLYLSNTNKIL